MSLINEALKRAKAAQQHAAPPAGPTPQLRPVEEAHRARRTLGLALPPGFALVALCGLFLAWQWHEKSEPSTVTAKTPGTAAVSTGPAPTPFERRASVAAAGQGGAVTPASGVKVAVVAQGAVPADPGATPATATASVSAQPLSGATPSIPVSEAVANVISNATPTNLALKPATPKPAPLKLQAIIFHPTRPSALINGRTVFLRDRFEGYRVAAITPETVTLIGAGRTNCLTLP